MKTCCVCSERKPDRSFSAHVEAGDVCTACCLLGKVPAGKASFKAQRERSKARPVRVWFRGEMMTFQSLAAAAKWVGCSDLTIRRVALGRVPTSKAFCTLKIKFLKQGIG